MEPTLQSPPLTVSAVNEQVRAAVSGLREVRVQGEVSNARPSSGHLYFELKDASSRIRVTVWRQTVQRLGIDVRDGQQIIVTGRVDVWVQGGTYALNASRIESAGVGALWAALQKLKEKLQAEGLFAAERKVALPFLPRAVGIVTSPSGAALRDMVRILRDRMPVTILVAPAKVQGDGAADSIAKAIELLDGSGLCDVILCGRGGGSIEDLWAFNEERVVRAVSACRTPIISAVGHETDTLLSDYAADARAPTPTAAAEMAVPRMVDLRFQLDDAQLRLAQSITRLLANERRHLGGLTARLGDGGAITGHRALRLEDARRRLHVALLRSLALRQRTVAALRQRLHTAHPLKRLADQHRRLDGLQMRLARQAELIVQRRREALQRKAELLVAMSPTSALQRGYAIVRRADTGAALLQAATVHAGAGVEVLLRDGALDCRVEGVRLAGEPT